MYWYYVHSTHRLISLDSSFYQKFVCTLRVSKGWCTSKKSDTTPVQYISALASLFERYEYIHIIPTTSIPLQIKSHLCIPRKGTFMCLWAIYMIGLPILRQENMWTDRGNIHESLKDTWMWKLGLRPRNFFGVIFVSNFSYCVFAVHICVMFSYRKMM